MGMAGKVMSVDEAIGIIPDGATVGCAGFGGAGHPEALTAGIEARFLADNRPRDLTLVFAAGQGDGEGRGLDHLAHGGLIRRVIGGHFGLTPRLGKLIVEGDVEAYSFPSGVISRLYRAIASEQPGLLASIGLKTFVDPRLSGGRLNGRPAPDLVEVLTLRGREWLLYHAFPINVALVRGTTADERGNLSMEHEAHVGDAPASPGVRSAIPCRPYPRPLGAASLALPPNSSLLTAHFALPSTLPPSPSRSPTATAVEWMPSP
jgi:propionate CoA-transferase